MAPKTQCSREAYEDQKEVFEDPFPSFYLARIPNPVHSNPLGPWLVVPPNPRQFPSPPSPKALDVFLQSSSKAVSPENWKSQSPGISFLSESGLAAVALVLRFVPSMERLEAFFWVSMIRLNVSWGMRGCRGIRALYTCIYRRLLFSQQIVSLWIRSCGYF